MNWETFYAVLAGNAVFWIGGLFAKLIDAFLKS